MGCQPRMLEPSKPNRPRSYLPPTDRWHRKMLPDSGKVHEAQVQHLGTVFLRKSQHIFGFIAIPPLGRVIGCVIDRSISLSRWPWTLSPGIMSTWLPGATGQPANGCTVSNRIRSGLTGSHAYGLLDRGYKYLAVADLAGVGGFPDLGDHWSRRFSATTISIFILGMKSTTYSAPDKPPCGPSGGRTP